MSANKGKKNQGKHKNSGKSAKKGSFLKDTLMIVITAVALAMFLKAFIVDTRWVPSTSMVPTIEVDDRLIVVKLGYLLGQQPERGDIVVFKPPAELNERSKLIKRVIGLPGETLEVKDGFVYINGEPLAEDYLAERPNYQYGPVTVPEGCYFMMGDNRNTSYDSHRWLNPFIPENDIKSKAVWRYWPLDRIGGIYGDEDTADQ